MAWSQKFIKMSDEECAKFLYRYIKDTEYIVTDSEYEKAYKDVLKFIVGGVMVKEEFRLISEGAAEVIQKTMTNLPTANYYDGLRREHTIPISCLSDYIYENRAKLTEEELVQIINVTRGLSLITKDEDKKLNKNGLRSDFPGDYEIKDVIDDPKLFSIRYDKVHIKTMEIKDFQVD